MHRVCKCGESPVDYGQLPVHRTFTEFLALSEDISPTQATPRPVCPPGLSLDIEKPLESNLAFPWLVLENLCLNWLVYLVSSGHLIFVDQPRRRWLFACGLQDVPHSQTCREEMQFKLGLWLFWWQNNERLCQYEGYKDGLSFVS